jgi:DNA polymerase
MLIVEEIDKIFNLVNECKKCDLWENRTNPVVGDGSYSADVLFIGEAPGFNEDKQGKPFVGRAGKILDELLNTIGLNRKDVFIANILKCRPPSNRNPQKDEIESCTEYLDMQISLINPMVIVPLGNFAGSYIFDKYNLKNDKISNVHGKSYKVNTLFGSIIIFPVFHPAIATYNHNKKSILEKDFLKLKQILSNKTE